MMWDIDIKHCYKEQSKLNENDVRILMDWCKQQAHFPDISEKDVIIFLHCCYYSIEPAKNAMENFFTVRAMCPEFFAKRDPSNNIIQENSKIVFYAKLKQKSLDGYTVTLMKFLDSDPEKFDLTQHIKIFDMFSWVWWNEVGLTKGVCLVMDMNGSVFGHIKKINLMTLKKYLFYVQEAMPVRLKAIHVINALPFVDIILSMVKPFLKKEFFDLIHIHKQMDTFEKFVSVDCLPKDLGGSDGNIADIDAKEKANLVTHKDFLLSFENMIADESKRIGSPKNEGDLFGVEGTFKKLDID